MAGKNKGKKAKKKLFVICGVLVVIVAGGIFFGVSMHNRSIKAGNLGKTAVKSETVSTGNISSTIEGSGSIEVADTTDVTVPSGIKVKVILVESGDSVTKGQTLATLDSHSIISALADIEESIDSIEDALDADGISTLQKKKLKGERTELKASRKTLRALRKNPVITANADGVIGSVNVSEGSETSQSSGSSSSENSSQGMANMSSSGKITASAMNYSTSKTESSQETVNEASILRTTAANFVESGDGEEAPKTVITDFKDLSVEKPVTGKKPQSVIKETDDYTGAISWNLATDKFQEQIAYTATVTLTAKAGKVFSNDYTPSLENTSAITTKVSVVDGESVMIITAKYAKTAASQAAATKKPASTGSNSSQSGSQSGNNSSLAGKGASAGKSGSQTGNSSSSGSQNGNGDKSGSQTGNGSKPASQSGNSGSVYAGSVSSSAKSQADNTSGGVSSTSVSTKSSTSSGDTSLYSDSESVAFTIQMQDSVKVSLSVDELDILSVKEGQTATVTLDAIEDKEFEGTITKVSDSSSSGDGNAKYEVDITLEKDEDMRVGMTASATINISEANDVLTIPMNALQQKGEETFVYTKQDEDGNLSGEVTVETGLSDGQKVEITSGLSEGDTVYYTRTGSDNSSSMPNMGMERGNMTGGGDFGGFQKGNGNFKGDRRQRTNN